MPISPQIGFSQPMQIPIIDLLFSEDIGIFDQIKALEYCLTRAMLELLTQTAIPRKTALSQR